MRTRVSSNKLLLTNRKLLKVSRYPSAIRYLRDFMQSKFAVDYKLRFVERTEGAQGEGVIEIGSYKALNVQMALDALVSGGYSPTEIRWSDPGVIKKMNHRISSQR